MRQKTANHNRGSVLYSLQIGRAVAALAVILHHSAIASSVFFKGMPDLGFRILNLGYAGVDYFFVLSGFIIAYSTRHMKPNRSDGRKYVLARIIRIYIPYLPVSLLMIAALMIMPHISMGNRDSFSLLASLTLLPSEARPALAVARTLQYEMMFYTLFGICFFLFRNVKFIFLWIIPITALLFFETPRWMGIVAGLINMEFLFGIIAFYLYQGKQLFRFRYLLIGIGFLLVAIVSPSLPTSSVTTYHIRIWLGVGFAAIVLGLAYLESHVDFSRFRIFTLFGAASYALYLTHSPLISGLSRMLPSSLHGIFVFVILTITCCVAGLLYHQFLEKPLIGWVKRRFLPSKKRIIVS